MKKIAKMSLVAAVAIAGLTTTASAVDASGKVYVESVNNSEAANLYDIDFDLTLSEKISDTLSATVVIQADGGSAEKTNSPKPVLDLDSAYFTYTNAGAMVKYGRQAVNTPLTSDRGEGVFATYAATEQITVAGAYFANNSVAAFTADDISAVALLANFGVVNAQLWSVSSTAVATDTTIVLGANVGGVKIEARQATTAYETAGTKDGVTTKVSVSGKAGDISYGVDYLMADEDGASYVSDSDVANTLEATQLNAQNLADTTAFKIGASLPVSAATVALAYLSVEETKTVAGVEKKYNSSEAVVSAAYPLAKGATTKLTYSSVSADANSTANKNDSVRFEVKYTF